jgi:hypothetical protein
MISSSGVLWRKAARALAYLGIPIFRGSSTASPDATIAAGEGAATEEPLHLTRHFAVVSALALIVAAGLLSYLFASMATKELVANAQRNNVARTADF